MKPQPGRARLPQPLGCTSAAATANATAAVTAATSTATAAAAAAAAQATRAQGHSPSNSTRAQPKPRGRSRVCVGAAQATRAQPKSARAQPKPQGLSPPESVRAQPKPQGCSPKLQGHSALPFPQLPLPLLSLWSQRCQISPPLNACIAEPVRWAQSLSWRWRSVKRQHWCGDIDDGGGYWRGGSTAAFVVDRQQLAGRGLAALAVVSGTS